MTTPWNILIPPLISVSQEAAAAICRLWKSDHLQISLKTDESPVTQADRMSHDLISKVLHQLTPDIPVVSEEHTANHTEDYHEQLFWLLDPLDGTKEFIAGRADFCINLALIQDHQPIVGLLALPAYQTLYWAIKGHGAFKQLPSGATIRLADHQESTPGTVRMVCSLNHLDPRTKQYLSLYPQADIKAFGGARKMISLAEKEADLYPRFGPTMEWDTAAPHLILQECGGELWDVATALPLRYAKPGFKNDSFIGTSSAKPPIFTL